VLTSEELRVAALSASAKRGKWVARRRVFRRWVAWFTWSLLLPVIGLTAVIVSLAGLAFWQYLGHDAAYVAAQKWVQEEFGNFQVNLSNNKNSSLSPSKPANASMIPLTDEATPDLQIDRNLTLKQNI
jgi:cytoskeletal protein RodZ